MAAIDGRTDDLIELPATGGGSVRVHPVVFHRALDLVHGSGWQVRQEQSGLRVLVTAPGPPGDAEALARAVQGPPMWP